MKKKTGQIHILGPGAMGLLWASTFVAQGWSVTLLHRKPLYKKMTLQPVTLESAKGITQYPLTHTTASALKSKVSILLVTVKAHQLVAAIKPLLPKLNPNTIIILMQNGAGSDNELLHHYPQLKKNTVIQAVTTHAALRLNTLTVRQTGTGYCWLGFNPLFHENQKDYKIPAKLTALLEMDLINGWQPDIKQLLWKKLIINASINPLTAILHCKNGELLSKQALPLLTEIVSECCFIAQHAGVNINPHFMLKQVKQVCRQTAKNTSSMLQDVLNGSLTEIGYINQYLINVANKHQLTSPWNQCLTYIIKMLNRDRIHNYATPKYRFQNV